MTDNECKIRMTGVIVGAGMMISALITFCWGTSAALPPIQAVSTLSGIVGIFVVIGCLSKE